MDGYDNLYIEIFKKALNDDLNAEPYKMKCEIIEVLTNISDNYISLKVDKIINKYKKELESAIREKIYNETLCWPKSRKDYVYIKKYKDIKNKIIKEII